MPLFAVHCQPISVTRNLITSWISLDQAWLIHRKDDKKLKWWAGLIATNRVTLTNKWVTDTNTNAACVECNQLASQYPFHHLKLYRQSMDSFIESYDIPNIILFIIIILYFICHFTFILVIVCFILVIVCFILVIVCFILVIVCFILINYIF